MYGRIGLIRMSYNQKILIPIFTIVYARWLTGYKIVKVIGWRRMIVDSESGFERRTIEPTFMRGSNG